MCVCVGAEGGEGRGAWWAHFSHTHIQKHKITKEKDACKASPPPSILPPQLRHDTELSELRRAVLQAACAELDVLLREEEQRAHAVPDRVPKDSGFRVSGGGLEGGGGGGDGGQWGGAARCMLS